MGKQTLYQVWCQVYAQDWEYPVSLSQTCSGSKIGKVKFFIQGSTKMSTHNIWLWDFHSGTKKTVMSKKKVFVERNLKDCLPNLPLERGKEKKKIKVFLSRQFCDSLNYYIPI